MINRFDQFTPLTFNLPETPLEPLAGALQAKQQMYDTSQNLADDLSNQYIDALQKDQARANALTSGWQESIDAMVDNYNGDYSQMYGELRGLKRDITKAFSPQGEAGAIQANKSTWIEAVKRERAKVDAGKIRQEDFENWRNYEMSRYTGAGPADPETGAYNQLNPESIANYVDGEQLARAAAKEIAIRKGGSEAYRNMNGQWLTKVGNKWEELKAEEIQRVVQQSLLGNDAYMNYMRQKSRFADSDFDTDIRSAVTGYMAQMGETYDVDNRWNFIDKKINPIWMADYKAQKLESALRPKGYTRAGQTQSKGLDAYKMADPTRAGEVGSIKVSPGSIEARNQRISMESESVSSYWSRMKNNEKFEEAPTLKKVWDKAYADAASDPRYASMTEQERKRLLVKNYNDKLAQAAPNFDTSNPALTPSSAKVIGQRLANGLAFSDNVHWIKVNETGELGEPERAPSDLQQRFNDGKNVRIPVTDIANIGGTYGYEVATPDGNYVLVGAMTDQESAAVEPLATMTRAWKTGNETTSINLPEFDEQGGLVGYEPNVEMTVTVDGNLQRQVVLHGPEMRDANGNVIRQAFTHRLSPQEISTLEGNFAKSASIETQRNQDYHSNFYDQMDSKGLGDAINYSF